jgi:Proteasome-substrate-size regulator, mid region
MKKALPFCTGIDCNDMRKSVITFQFISTFAALIPFVDFSNASENHQLTEEEQQIRCGKFLFVRIGILLFKV